MQCVFIMQALKHYFLMDRGDLLESFLDSAEDEMAKPLQQVSLPRLQTLLDLGESNPKPYGHTISWNTNPSKQSPQFPCQASLGQQRQWDCLHPEERISSNCYERGSRACIFSSSASAAVRSSSGVAEAKGEELFCTIDTRRLQPMLHDLAPPKGNRKLRLPFVSFL